MTSQDETSMSALATVREAELRDAERRCADSFEAYWAGSASASIMRDYSAGRATTHLVGTSARRKTR